jgi:hypothetical protein
MSRNAPSGLSLLLFALVVAGVGATSTVTAAADGLGTHCIVRIDRFAFRPDTVPEGGQTVLGTVVENCTDDAITVTLTQFGTEPSPCPVIDPVSRSVTLSPVGTFAMRTAITGPSCAGIEYMTLRVTGPGGQRLAEHTAHLTVTAPVRQDPARRR